MKNTLKKSETLIGFTAANVDCGTVIRLGGEANLRIRHQFKGTNFSELLKSVSLVNINSNLEAYYKDIDYTLETVFKSEDLDYIRKFDTEKIISIEILD